MCCFIDRRRVIESADVKKRKNLNPLIPLKNFLDFSKKSEALWNEMFSPKVLTLTAFKLEFAENFKINPDQLLVLEKTAKKRRNKSKNKKLVKTSITEKDDLIYFHNVNDNFFFTNIDINDFSTELETIINLTNSKFYSRESFFFENECQKLEIFDRIKMCLLDFPYTDGLIKIFDASMDAQNMEKLSFITELRPDNTFEVKDITLYKFFIF